jgi:hypothetical protein
VRRSVARCFLVVALAGPAVLLRASPCGACTCAVRSPAQLLRRADAAFVGSVVEQQPIDQTTTVQTFAVRSVYKGSLGPTVDVLEPIGSGGGDTCGILYGPGEVAVILSRQGDGWTTDACARISVDALARVAPSPTHPVPTPTTTLAPGPTVPVGSAGSGGVGWRAIVLGLLGGIAAIAAALSLASRRDRSRSGTGPTSDQDPEHRSDEPPDPGLSG